MRSNSTTKCFALIILAAYLFALFGSPTVSYADEKSSRAKSEAEGWPRKNRASDDSADAELKVTLVIVGILMVAVIIDKIAKGHGDDQEQKSEAQKTPLNRPVLAALPRLCPCKPSGGKMNKNHRHVCRGGNR